MERFSKWVTGIRCRAYERYTAHKAYLGNLTALKPTLHELATWQTRTIDELGALNQTLLDTHVVLVTEQVDYAAVIKAMGVVELIIYFPRVFRQRHEQTEVIDTVAQMINITTEVISFTKEYQMTRNGE